MSGSAPKFPSDQLDVRSRRALVAGLVLLVAVCASVAHQWGPLFRPQGWALPHVRWNLWEWYVEDAAISFAYARNWAEGDGLVAFRGGERIEGYSNPLWVALMALFYLVGVDGFTSAKWMSVVFGGVTVVLAYLFAREVIDDEDDPWSPMIVPITLSVMPQFGFWNASGLENSLFNLMMTGGLWRTMVEARTGSYPWSAVWFLGLAVTRPEGILYAAWAGFLGLLFAQAAGRGLKPSALWLATFFVPFTVYHAVRYDYFAWMFPNTYYAKLGDKEFRPMAWGSRGWNYVRGFAVDSGYGWFYPVHLAGLLGLRTTRSLLLWAVAAPLVALLFLYPNAELTRAYTWWPADLPEPEWWKEARIWGIFSLALLLPVSVVGERRSQGRVLCWGMALITLFFCLRSNGDWMNGYRWMSFLVVPACTLFAAGVHELTWLAQRWFGGACVRGWSTPGWLLATMLVAALMPGFVEHSEWFFKKKVTSPDMVHERVDYTESLMRRMFVEGQVRNLDVDMGAHMYWADDLMIDMAGLIDTTIAHHSFSQRDVIKEYIFEEMKPHIAHVHGAWAKTSGIPNFPEWKADYVGVPGFPAGKTALHIGNHVRRDLLMRERWEGPQDRRVVFGDGITLSGFKLPSPEISRGRAVFLEVGLEYRKVHDRQSFRVIGFFSNEQGKVSTFDVPVGYDWLPPEEWLPEEVFVGRYAPVVHRDLEPGMYDLGFVVLGADGAVIPAGQLLDEQGLPARAEVGEGIVVGGRDGVAARVAVGEVRFPGVLKIGDANAGERAAKADRDRALKLAAEDRCVDAETSWRMAWRHVPLATSWHEANGAPVREALAGCWIRRAAAEQALEEASRQLETARYWAYRHPELHAVQERVGAALFAEGQRARAAADWETAFSAFLSAVRANPSLSWARRYAEEARDHRHGIDEASLAAAARDREERQERAREERAAREQAEADEQPAGADPAGADPAEAAADPAGADPAEAAADPAGADPAEAAADPAEQP